MDDQKQTRRMSYGKCLICNSTFSKGKMPKHIQLCIAEHETALKPSAKQTSERASIFHIIAQGYGQPEYWLHLEARSDTTLKKLDEFLRETWLECCGHMSAFRSNGTNYMSYVYERGDKSMNVTLDKAFSVGMTVRHEYDFGTTTELALKIASERVGESPSKPIRLLARNDPPDFNCYICGESATQLCTECILEDQGWLCDKCAGEDAHECDEDMLMPVVNSPRVGMCGYTGTPY